MKTTRCRERVQRLSAWLPVLFAGLLLGERAGLGAQTIWREGFETDDFWDRWHVQGGVWAVGRPASGPSSTPAPGQRCAGTVLNGNYPASADARLVRDEPFVVPPASESPRLRFWHWNNNFPEDPGTVEIRPLGGSWQTISPVYVWNSRVWTRTTLDLREFAGQTVTLAFRFRANGDANVATGWYVDNIEVVTGVSEFDIINRPERFESGLGDWSVDHGTWEVGVPGSGPRAAYSGIRCAGTVLHGNYDARTMSRLISPEFDLPEPGAYPRLRFWHWVEFAGGDGGTVEIRSEGGDWTLLTGVASHTCGSWTPATLDLREYGGQRVQIAFRIGANTDAHVASGWYVDDIEVKTGTPVMAAYEGFEHGLGDWVVDRGVWEVGRHPANLGPRKALEGLGCAGTVLNGSYCANADSRLISPEFEVADASEHPRLRFWHWNNNFPSDTCTVEVRSRGTAWQNISPVYIWNSQVWTQTTLDLTAFAGQTVQVAFRFRSNSDANVAAGWYIDGVEVVTGRPDFDIINQPERFTRGQGEWNVDRGIWQVGLPTAGPKTAYSRPFCAGTILDGNYAAYSNSRLISPEFDLPPANAFPRLRFWHWYHTARGDVGTVQIRTPDAGWHNLASYGLENRSWTRATLDLAAFAGKRVQIGFLFQANSDNQVGAGWYVDDVEVATGRAPFTLVNNPEGFEAGLGDWEVEAANWQVGRPTNGPPAAFRGNWCAGTVLDGHYDPSVDTRLISPEFIVPCLEAAPRLRFAHWYALGTGDEVWVELRELPHGIWNRIPGLDFRGTSGDWSTAFLDLASQAGKRIQLAFRLRGNGDASVGPGWYLDEVRIQAEVAPPLADRHVMEGELLSFPVTSHCRNVRFRLEDPPAGAMVDPDFGVFTWQPDVCQGPGTYVLKFILEDAVSRLPLGFLTHQIEVRDVNPPPVFGVIEPLAIRAGVAVEFTASDYAYDASCPPQQLTYTLDPGSPPNATIHPTTGVLSWIPTDGQATQVHPIHLRVTDNGNPPLSATTTVLAYPLIRLSRPTVEAGQLRFAVEGGSPGFRCELVTAPTVSAAAADWMVVEERTWPETGPVLFLVPLGNEPGRFYHLRLSPP